MYVKALAEIYTIHTFAPMSWNLVWLKRYVYENMHRSQISKFHFEHVQDVMLDSAKLENVF